MKNISIELSKELTKLNSLYVITFNHDTNLDIEKEYSKNKIEKMLSEYFKYKTTLLISDQKAEMSFRIIIDIDANNRIVYYDDNMDLFGSDNYTYEYCLDVINQINICKETKSNFEDCDYFEIK